MTLAKIKTPELEKINEHSAESQLIGNFLDWLNNEKNIILSKQVYDETESQSEGYFPARESIEDLLAEYFKIDLKKAEIERQNILKEIRKK